MINLNVQEFVPQTSCKYHRNATNYSKNNVNLNTIPGVHCKYKLIQFYLLVMLLPFEDIGSNIKMVS